MVHFSNTVSLLECLFFTHETAFTFHKVHNTNWEFPSRLTKTLPVRHGASWSTAIKCGEHLQKAPIFVGRKLLLLEQKKHQGQCVNDDPMIPSSFLSSTGNTYTYTNPRSVNRNIWPMSTLKSCSLFDRSTCHSLRGWTSGTAIRGNLEWMMLCRTTKVPRLDTFGSLKPKKNPQKCFVLKILVLLPFNHELV